MLSATGRLLAMGRTRPCTVLAGKDALSRGRRLLDTAPMSGLASRLLALSLLCVAGVAGAQTPAVPAPAPAPAPADGAIHYLEEGESLSMLARVYGVPLSLLMARNGITTDEQLANLQIGAPIVVPGVKLSEITHKKPAARKGVTHQLAPGETLSELAKMYGVSVREIMTANRLSEDDASKLRDGKRLFLPGVEKNKQGKIERKPTRLERQALAKAKRLGLGSVAAAGRLLHGYVEERWSTAALEAGRFGGTLKWPVNKGWFTRGYGSGAGGYHKAMDIMSPLGTNVRAAANGIVGYSGDGLKGFGNMVMIVHAGGWVTLYAHNSINFAKAGQLVKRNDVIAEVGSTGRSMGPHVHFELIHENKNCDPAPLFRPGVKRRNGSLARIKYASWPRPGQRPEEVRCAKRTKHPLGHSVMNENPEVEATPVPEDPNAPDPAQHAPSEAPETNDHL
jgi:murein DD-endopeptidase MepM/ murein hydrolase activator NlpD